MRSVRRLHTLFLVLLFIFDLIINSFAAAFLPIHILFISNLHFMGILILSQHETKESSLVKAAVFGLVMELIHSGTFPVYIIAYCVSVSIIRMWERYIGYSVIEFIIMVVIGLFLKEVLIYGGALLLNNYALNMFDFIATRVFWVIVGNVLLIPIVRKGYALTHKAIIKRAENIYLKFDR